MTERSTADAHAAAVGRTRSAESTAPAQSGAIRLEARIPPVSMAPPSPVDVFDHSALVEEAANATGAGAGSKSSLWALGKPSKSSRGGGVVKSPRAPLSDEEDEGVVSRSSSDGAQGLGEDGEWQLACASSALVMNKGVKVRVGGVDISLFKVKTDRVHVYALSDQCSHQGASIAKGDIEEVDGMLCVKCPAHGVKYQLKNGKAPRKGRFKQRSFPVKKVGKEVWVKVD